MKPTHPVPTRRQEPRPGSPSPLRFRRRGRESRPARRRGDRAVVPEIGPSAPSALQLELSLADVASVLSIARYAVYANRETSVPAASRRVAMSPVLFQTAWWRPQKRFSASLAPVPVQTFTGAPGTSLNAGKVYVWLAASCSFQPARSVAVARSFSIRTYSPC